MTKSEDVLKQKMEQLDNVVAWFEGDTFELQQAATKLKEASKLATEIEHELDSVENDIREVKKSFASQEEA